MSEQEVNRKDYGCIRSKEVGNWMRDKTSICWKDKDMEYHSAVDVYSKELERIYRVNLNFVSSEAIRPYMDLLPPTEEELGKAEDEDPKKYRTLKRRLARSNTKEAKDFRRVVLKMIISTIKSNKNPFSGEDFGYTGLTRNVVSQIIQFCKTGEPYLHSYKKCVTLSRDDLAMVESMFGFFKSVVVSSENTPISLEDVDFIYEKIVSAKTNEILGVKSHKELVGPTFIPVKAAQEGW